MIFLYHGPDTFSMHEAVQRQLRAALPAETADLNLTRLSAEEVTVDTLRFASEAAPFLADRRAVVVEGFFTRGGTRRGRSSARAAGDGASSVVDAIAEYLPRVPANTLLVFVETAAPPKTGSVARALEAARVKQQFFPTLMGAPLVRWIRERARTQGGQIAEPAAHLLAAFAGGDLRALTNEIAKLIAYAGPGRTIEPDYVRLLVSQARNVNIFALVDAVGQGQPKTALSALHALLEAGERHERILGMIARQVRLLLQARDLADRGARPAEVAKALGLSPFPLRKVQEQARLFTVPRLIEMHRRTREADVSLKTGQQEPALALELLIAELVPRR